MPENKEVSYGQDALNAKFDEYAKRIEKSADHCNEMNKNLIEKLDSKLESQNKVMDERLASQNEKMDMRLKHSEELNRQLIEKIEAKSEAAEDRVRVMTEAIYKNMEMMERNSKEATERFESLTKETSATFDRLTMEVKNSNNQVKTSNYAYLLTTLVGFATVLLAILGMVWSVKSLQLPSQPSLIINPPQIVAPEQTVAPPTQNNGS